MVNVKVYQLHAILQLGDWVMAGISAFFVSYSLDCNSALPLEEWRSMTSGEHSHNLKSGQRPRVMGFYYIIAAGHLVCLYCYLTTS